MVASDAPETALDDDAVVGAETARATVEALDDEEDDCEPLRALRGDATAEAGLAQAVRRARCEEDAELRGATTLELERATVLVEIIVVLVFSEMSFCRYLSLEYVAFVRLSVSEGLARECASKRGKRKRGVVRGAKKKEGEKKKKKIFCVSRPPPLFPSLFFFFFFY